MPLCLAIAAPVSSRCPRKPASAAFSSATDCTCRFGTTSTWTGAWGLISSNATARSSSWTILEGIFFSAILQKMQSLICVSPVGPDPLAAGPSSFPAASTLLVASFHGVPLPCPGALRAKTGFPEPPRELLIDLLGLNLLIAQNQEGMEQEIGRLVNDFFALATLGGQRDLSCLL